MILLECLYTVPLCILVAGRVYSVIVLPPLNRIIIPKIPDMTPIHALADTGPTSHVSCYKPLIQSAKRGSNRFHFKRLWYDATQDWTWASRLRDGRSDHRTTTSRLCWRWFRADNLLTELSSPSVNNIRKKMMEIMQATVQRSTLKELVKIL